MERVQGLRHTSATLGTPVASDNAAAPSEPTSYTTRPSSDTASTFAAPLTPARAASALATPSSSWPCAAAAPSVATPTVPSAVHTAGAALAAFPAASCPATTAPGAAQGTTVAAALRKARRWATPLPAPCDA